MFVAKPEIIKSYGIISHETNDDDKWVKEVNIVKWGNAAEEKLDIRAWKKNHEIVGKGIALTLEEEELLFEILSMRKQERARQQAGEQI